MCSIAVIYTSGHAKAVKQSDEAAAIWCAKTTKDGDPFWFLKHHHFLFHSNSPWRVQIVLLKPHNYPSSLRISFFFFLLLFPPTLGLVFMFFSMQLRRFHSLLYSHLLLLLQLLASPPLPSTLWVFFFSAYLWSRCSFPSRSPTQRSPGFSLPAGPGLLHMKTPVQVVHTRAYLYQWFINTRVERKWIRHFQ